MKIQSVTYRRHKNLGDYNNESLEATAQIEETDDLERVILALRDFVTEQLTIPESVTSLKSEQVSLEQEASRLQAQIKSAQERWDKIQQFFEKLGVKLSTVVEVDDIPF